MECHMCVAFLFGSFLNLLFLLEQPTSEQRTKIHILYSLIKTEYVLQFNLSICNDSMQLQPKSKIDFRSYNFSSHHPQLSFSIIIIHSPLGSGGFQPLGMSFRNLVMVIKGSSCFFSITVVRNCFLGDCHSNI